MRRTLSIFIASALLAASVSSAFAQKTRPDLSGELRDEVVATQVQADPVKHLEVISQPGVRITSKSDGLIRVTRAELQSAGFDVNASSANWQLFLEGVELPIIVGANDAYIEFLGKELDTVESDIRAYYLIVGTQAGKRISSTQVKASKGKGPGSNSYPQTTVKKERTSYINQILNGPLDNHFGRVVYFMPSAFEFNLTGVDRSRGDRSLTVAIQGFSLVQHNIQLSLNGHMLEPLTGFGRQFMTRTYSIPVAYLREGLNSLEMYTLVGPDTNLFDHISIQFPRNYIAEDNRLDFTTERNKGARLSGFTTPNVRVFDVTSETAPTELIGAEVTATGGTYGPNIPADRSRVFYATEAANFAQPMSVTQNNPALLGVPTESGKLVIIAHPSLMGAAQTWGNYRTSQGIGTKVIDVTEIFDEFSYGVSSSHAIEAFLSYAKANWQVKPDYVLLIGDGSYDTKNYAGEGYWNMVPTRMVNTKFEETGSDEALADFNNDGLAEIPIGRIPARTPAAVMTVFNKTVAWETNLGSNPLDRGALFAYDQPDGYNFQAMSERIMATLPTAMSKTTVQRGNPDSTTAQNELISAFNSGKYIANYSGHGTAAAWRDGNFFADTQISLLTNANSPTLVTALTCLNAYFVDPQPYSASLAEQLISAPNGGAVAIWASTGQTTPDVQEVMAMRFYQQIGLGAIPRLGDLVKDAKAQLSAGSDVRLSWALMGDPMLKVR